MSPSRAKYYAGGPLPGAPAQLVRHGERDQLHAAESRRLHRSARGSRGGATHRGVRRRRRTAATTRAPKTWNLERQDRRDRRAHAAPRLPVGEAGDADVGDGERVGHRRQPPDLVGVGRADRASVASSTSASRRRSRSSRRARRSTRRDRRRSRRQGRCPARRSRSRPCGSTGSTRRASTSTKEVDPQTCAVVAAKDASPCSFATKEGGTYQVTATIIDTQGRPNQTQADVLGLAVAISRRSARSSRSSSS